MEPLAGSCLRPAEGRPGRPKSTTCVSTRRGPVLIMVGRRTAAPPMTCGASCNVRFTPAAGVSTARSRRREGPGRGMTGRSGLSQTGVWYYYIQQLYVYCRYRPAAVGRQHELWAAMPTGLGRARPRGHWALPCGKQMREKGGFVSSTRLHSAIGFSAVLAEAVRRCREMAGVNFKLVGPDACGDWGVEIRVIRCVVTTLTGGVWHTT